MSQEIMHLFEGNDSFEAQFFAREKFETAGGTVEVVDVRSEKPNTEIPTFLAPGWAMTIDVYKTLAEKLVEEKGRFISINYLSLGGEMEGIPKEDIERYSSIEINKALSVLDVLEQKDIEKIDVLAHSEGAINICIAAVLHPEKFRNIILYNPAGMMKDNTFTALLKRINDISSSPETLAKMKEEMNLPESKKEAVPVWVREMLKYIAKNPVRSAKEALNISQSQIYDLIRYLHEQGIGISIMSGVDDPLFPPEKMQEFAKADMLDGFASIRGDHGIPVEKPFTEPFAKAIVYMFASLENKRKKNESKT